VYYEDRYFVKNIVYENKQSVQKIYKLTHIFQYMLPARNHKNRILTGSMYANYVQRFW